MLPITLPVGAPENEGPENRVSENGGRKISMWNMQDLDIVDNEGPFTYTDVSIRTHRNADGA